jgi:DNA-binding MarR family transcriptional regulator
MGPRRQTPGPSASCCPGTGSERRRVVGTCGYESYTGWVQGEEPWGARRSARLYKNLVLVVICLSQIEMPGSTPLLDQAPALTTELAKVLARIGRGLRYRTRAVREALEVTHSEAELLKLLDRKPGIRVQDAAEELGVASNSVSTLVKQLTRAGLVERASDPFDGRVAQLRLTPLAEEWVTRVGNAREAAIGRALDTLDDADRALLEAALPAMGRLAKAISRSDGPTQ